MNEMNQNNPSVNPTAISPFYATILAARRDTIEYAAPVMARALGFNLVQKGLHFEDTLGEGHPVFISGSQTSRLPRDLIENYMIVERGFLPMIKQSTEARHLTALTTNTLTILMDMLRKPQLEVEQTLLTYFTHHIRQRLWQLPLGDFITPDERDRMVSVALQSWQGLFNGLSDDQLRGLHYCVLQQNIGQALTGIAQILGIEFQVRGELKRFAIHLCDHHRDVLARVNAEASPAHWAPPAENTRGIRDILDPFGVSNNETLSMWVDERIQRFLAQAQLVKEAQGS